MSSSLRNIKAPPSVHSQNPLFRRVIIPWYDAEPVCYFILIFMAAVIIFSLTGIFEANSTPEYKKHLWIPLLLFCMSFVVFISTILRLVRRNSER
ncbi:MAG: hypothetical protein PVI90_19710 [Desulfobacteraceae bacterium]|jgi:hypothetical protein